MAKKTLTYSSQRFLYTHICSPVQAYGQPCLEKTELYYQCALFKSYVEATFG